MKLWYLLFLFLVSANSFAIDPLLEWANNKKAWALSKMQEGSTSERFDKFVDFYFPEKKVPINPNPEERRLSDETKKLFLEYFDGNDPSSYIGTFFESGHPYVTSRLGPYQWNSLHDSGLDDHEVFRKVIRTLVRDGIRNFRLAPLLHVDNTTPFLEKIRIIWEEGGTPIITMVWFPSFKKWEVLKPDGSVNYPGSYILNKNWPYDVAKKTEELMTKLWSLSEELEKKTGKKHPALVNGVNEPETLAGFNRHFWHGAFANWGSEEKLRYYVLSAIRIAEANVLIRKAVETTAGGRRVLFVHNEAMTPNYYPSHQGLSKYTVSSLMLGEDEFLKTDFKRLLTLSLKDLEKAFAKKKLSITEGLVKAYVFGPWNKTNEDRLRARGEIINELSMLQILHQDLKRTTGKTVKTDSLLYLDYYYQTEYHPVIPVPKLAKKLSSFSVLKDVLKAKDDEALFNFIKHAYQKIDRDYSPVGPEGPVLPFTAKNLSYINLSKALVQNDYLILERLIGLRREFTFIDTEEFKRRRAIGKIGDDSKVIFRTDHLLENLLENQAKLLKEVFGARSESELRRKIGVEGKRSLRDFLEENGRSRFNKLFGLKVEYMIGFEPQHYARQIRAGVRYGFYHFFMEYINALRLYVVGVGESGTPYYYFANLLHNQVMMEYITALQSGVQGSQYVFGPAVDTVGWARSPLGHHWDEDHEVNPSGILRLENGEPKFRGNEAIGEKWAVDFMNSVFQNMKPR